MSLLLYAVADCSLAEAADGVGVDGCALEAIGEDGLVAIVSEHQRRPELTEDALWAFERGVELRMSDNAVLPARFGSVFAERQPLEAVLRDRRAEFMEKFERVRGAVELGVRASWPAAEPDSTPSGPDAGSVYMRARLERGARARDIAAQIDDAVGSIARAKSCQVLTRPTVPVTASYLVDRERTDEFVTGVRALDATMQDTQLICTGPWPPYSFVGQESHD